MFLQADLDMSVWLLGIRDSGIIGVKLQYLRLIRRQFPDELTQSM